MKKQLRCAYVERDMRCRRAGTGNPPLCEPHRMVLEEEAARPPRPGERFVNLLGRAFRGQKLNDEQILGGIEDLVGVFQSHSSYAAVEAKERLREPARRFQRNGQQRQQQAPPQSRKPAGPDPRIVLGFPIGQKLTAEAIKKRHRELARKHHPDRGGSVAKMQEVNAAVDRLLATL